ncbi:uncharacterized protein PY1_contig-32-2 [Novosphingobium sp. PY1]|nr:uncharacterized protein PY1_contig-32-2 [Novosphingobium sp. PY1]
MPKRLTPIERAIAGAPQDRRQRYEAKLRDQGLTYARILVPVDDVEQVRAFARDLIAKRQATDSSLSSEAGDHD